MEFSGFLAGGLLFVLGCDFGVRSPLEVYNFHIEVLAQTETESTCGSWLQNLQGGLASRAGFFLLRGLLRLDGLAS